MDWAAPMPMSKTSQPMSCGRKFKTPTGTANIQYQKDLGMSSINMPDSKKTPPYYLTPSV